MSAILIDGREFVAGRRTGIGRFLEGLLLAITEAHPQWRLTVAMTKGCALPASLETKVCSLYVPHAVELWWPRLATGYALFLSPYPKLPWLRLPCPAVHTVHDVLYLIHPAYRGNALRVLAGRIRLKRALHLAAMTWFDSAASMGACESIGGSRRSEVRFPAVASGFTPGKGSDMGTPYFLYVGNGLPHKNVPLLLAAMRDLPAKLVLVGIRQGDAMLTGVDAGLREKVECLQGVDDERLLALYRGATALLLPSTAEGFGYPPLEAMACGTPAIVADIPVLKETTGEAAMLCAPHDVNGWQRAMASMLQPEVRAEWADRGAHWVAPLLAPQGWATHIADLEQLLGAR